MTDVALAGLMSPLLLVGILASLEIGRRYGRRRLAEDREHALDGTGAVDGALFALLGLLMAVTFSGASARFDARRQLIVEEANALGTVWLRLDLLPLESQASLRDLLRQYADARLAAHRGPPDDPSTLAARTTATALQARLWGQVVAATKIPNLPSSVTTLLVGSVNELFDIATTRTMATRLHPPRVVYVMLFVLAFVSAVLAGFGMASGTRRRWLHVGAFAAILTAVVYVTIDIEHPRQGLVRVDEFDQALLDVRNSMQ